MTAAGRQGICLQCPHNLLLFGAVAAPQLWAVKAAAMLHMTQRWLPDQCRAPRNEWVIPETGTHESPDAAGAPNFIFKGYRPPSLCSIRSEPSTASSITGPTHVLAESAGSTSRVEVNRVLSKTKYSPGSTRPVHKDPIPSAHTETLQGGAVVVGGASSSVTAV